MTRSLPFLLLLTLALPARSQVGPLKTTLRDGVLLGPPTALPLPSGKVLLVGGFGLLRVGGEAGSALQLRDARVNGQLVYSKKTRLLAEISLADGKTAEVTRLQGTYVLGDGSPQNLSVTVGQLWQPFGFAPSENPTFRYAPERPRVFRESGDGPFASQEFDRGIRLDIAPKDTTFSLALLNGTGRETGKNLGDVVGRVQHARNGLTLGASVYSGREKIRSLTGLDARYDAGQGPFVQTEWLRGTAGGVRVSGGHVTGGFTFDRASTHPWSLIARQDILRGASSETGFGVAYNLDAGVRVRLFTTKNKATADALFAL